MRNRLLVVLAATGLFATQAVAQEYSNFYIGVGISQVDMETDVSIGPGQSTSYSDWAPGATGFFGYTFDKFLSIEAGMTSTGRSKGSGSFAANPLNPNTVKINGETDFSAFELVLKGTIPIWKFELFGRAGFVAGDTDNELYIISRDDATGVTTPSKLTSSYQDTGMVLGIGAGYNFGRGAIRLQYDYMGIEMQGTENSALTVLDPGPTFTQSVERFSIATDNPSRLMLSVSGYF